MNDEYYDEISRTVWILETKHSICSQEQYFGVYDSEKKAQMAAATLIRNGQVVDAFIYKDEVQ